MYKQWFCLITAVCRLLLFQLAFVGFQSKRDQQERLFPRAMQPTLTAGTTSRRALNGTLTSLRRRRHELRTAAPKNMRGSIHPKLAGLSLPGARFVSLRSSRPLGGRGVWIKPHAVSRSRHSPSQLYRTGDGPRPMYIPQHQGARTQEVLFKGFTTGPRGPCPFRVNTHT